MQKGRDPDVEVKKGVPLFHVFKGWVQARLVVITATFTYGGSYTPHPPSGLPGIEPGVFCKHVSFSPCSRCKRIVCCPVRPVIYVSAVRSLPPLRARFLHYCLLGSRQSKKHAHLARIIRRSSLNSVLNTARVFRPCALPGPRSPDGLPSAIHNTCY